MSLGEQYAHLMATSIFLQQQQQQQQNPQQRQQQQQQQPGQHAAHQLIPQQDPSSRDSQPSSLDSLTLRPQAGIDIGTDHHSSVMQYIHLLPSSLRGYQAELVQVATGLQARQEVPTNNKIPIHMPSSVTDGSQVAGMPIVLQSISQHGVPNQISFVPVPGALCVYPQSHHHGSVTQQIPQIKSLWSAQYPQFSQQETGIHYQPGIQPVLAETPLTQFMPQSMAIQVPIPLWSLPSELWQTAAPAPNTIPNPSPRSSFSSLRTAEQAPSVFSAYPTQEGRPLQSWVQQSYTPTLVPTQSLSLSQTATLSLNALPSSHQQAAQESPVERKAALAVKGICQHGKRKVFCKDCGGSRICQHNKRKSRCKECGGSEICQHNRQRHHCKDCRGSGICQHMRRRRQCKECADLAATPQGQTTQQAQPSSDKDVDSDIQPGQSHGRGA